jgi:type IV secretion system protein VirD4
VNIIGNWCYFEQKPDKSVLFILDEIPALGRLSMVKQAYGLMAGFGIQLWGIVQDLSPLKKIYGESWETFVGNSGVLQYFGSRDRTTAEYFSALCGVKTVWTFSSALSHSFSSGSGSSSTSNSSSETTSLTQRKLIFLMN